MRYHGKKLEFVILLAAASLVRAQGPRNSIGTSTVYSFTVSNGAEPISQLLVNPNGDLYGTAWTGGSSEQGVVFELTPPAAQGDSWTYTQLYSFTGEADGGHPGTGLIGGPGGVLYGVTTNGGSAHNGTIFQLKPPTESGGQWTEQVLYNFPGGANGTSPFAPLLLGGEGTLYGTAPGGASGYGIAFELQGSKTGTWTYTVLRTFTGGDDCANPAGALTSMNGDLYGMCSYGGTANFGAIFQLAPPTKAGESWTETVLYSFQGGDNGANPIGALLAGSSGGLYGTTSGGGSAGYGTVFRLEPNGSSWVETLLYSFLGGSDGESPAGPLALGENNALCGATVFGGTNNNGTVFAVTPPAVTGGAWTESILHRFQGGSDGNRPQFGVVSGPNSTLYGTTEFGGTAGVGTVFEVVM
jgi:uncharacterized repeat protein (TIGR03803 family)